MLKTVKKILLLLSFHLNSHTLGICPQKKAASINFDSRASHITSIRLFLNILSTYDIQHNGLMIQPPSYKETHAEQGDLF